MKELQITMEDDTWMDKTGGYAKDMTLRDAFALAVMQGWLASASLPKSVLDDTIAEAAYELADAMLKAGK